MSTRTTIAAKGTINTENVTFTIAANDQIIDPEPFNDVIIAYRNGGPIRIRDVGEAVAGASDRTVAAYQNGKPGILLIVYKQPGANVIETVDQIKETLPRLVRNIPPSIDVTILQDRTTTIRASVEDVEFTLLLTIVLVVLVILLFLRNFWATVIPGVTVPLALLGSFAMMYLLGFSLDNLSLMALTIAVGFVVDDAIVVVENIHRHIEDGESPMEAALKGSSEIGFTVLSISFSLIAVFIPLLLMGGIIGRLFREFALTVTASIAVSALVSLTLAPMLASRFMRPETHDHGRVYRAIESVFDGHAVVLPAHPRRRAAPPGDHARRVLHHHGHHRRDDGVHAQGLLPDPGHRPDHRHLRGLAGYLAGGDDAPPARDRRGAARRPGDRGRGFADRLDLRRADDEHRPATASSSRRATSATSTPRRSSTACGPKLAKITGVTAYLQPAQDITVGGRIARAAFQYTLQDPNIAELNEWAGKMLAKMRTLPEVVDVGTDLLVQRAAAQGHHQPRSGLAVRHFGADDRRHPQRRLRAAADHPVFHPAQHLLDHRGDPAAPAEEPGIARPYLREVAAHRRRRAVVRAGRRRLLQDRAAVH